MLYLLILIALVTLGEDIIHDRCHRVAIHGFLQRIFTASAGIKNNGSRSRCTISGAINTANKMCGATVFQLDDNGISCLKGGTIYEKPKSTRNDFNYINCYFDFWMWYTSFPGDGITSQPFIEYEIIDKHGDNTDFYYVTISGEVSPLQTLYDMDDGVLIKK